MVYDDLGILDHKTDLTVISKIKIFKHKVIDPSVNVMHFLLSGSFCHYVLLLETFKQQQQKCWVDVSRNVKTIHKKCSKLVTCSPTSPSNRNYCPFKSSFRQSVLSLHLILEIGELQKCAHTKFSLWGWHVLLRQTTFSECHLEPVVWSAAAGGLQSPS